MRRRRRDFVLPIVLAAAVFAGVALTLKVIEREATEGLLERAGRAEPRATVAAIDRAVRAMQLIAVTYDTKVTSTSTDDSWRGAVSANVTAPVRLLFGTDLQNAQVVRRSAGPLAEEIQITLPAPTRLGTEIQTTGEEHGVTIGWLRFRTRAGEFYLGEARKQLSEAAAKLELSPETQREVRAQTRARVEELVRLIAAAGAKGEAGGGAGREDSDRVRVRVVFADEGAGLASGSAP
ncbi:hypothetical protein BH11PLA1_BH11PLA1_24010 [soil metagenome]